MSWNLYHTATPSGGPTGPVAAGSILWDNWKDNSGSTYSINASNQLTCTTSLSTFKELLRPSTENTQDQRIVWTIDTNVASVSNAVNTFLRRQSSDDWYMIQFDPINFSGQMTVDAKVSGSTVAPTGTISATVGTVSSNNVHFATAYNTAHSYSIDVAAQGISPTTLSCTVTDITNSSVVCQFTVTDTGSTLQNSTGYPGVGFWSGSTPPVIGGSIQLYNWTTGLTPGTLTLGTTGSTTQALSLATNSTGTAPYSNQLQQAPDVAGSPGTFANSGAPQSGTTASWSVTGLTPSTKYWWRVVVTDAVPNSANSNQVTATTASSSLAPGTPSITAGTLTSITVASTAPTGGTGTGYTYQLQRSVTSGSGFANVTSATSTPWTDSTVSPGTLYYYRWTYTDSGSNSTTSAQVSGVSTVYPRGAQLSRFR